MRYDLPDCLTAGLEARASWRVPLDECDVAVRLECDGVTDSVAADGYGFTGVHQMAAAWYPRLSGIAEAGPPAPGRKNPIIEHLRGTAFALPLAICCLTMIRFGYSLWGGDLEGNTAAAVAIGTIASFVVTGGLVQAMAWQGLFYAGSGDFRMSHVACRRWSAYGGLTLAATAVAGFLLNAQYSWLGGNLVWLAVAFYLALGLLWIGTGILYIVESPMRITAAALCGIAVVLLLRGAMHLPLLASQIAGVLTAAAFAFIAGFTILRKRHAGDGGRVYPRMVRRTVYLTAPYLAYGSLYYLLLFGDRLIAWTAHTGAAATPLVFRGDYELPHDVALLGFIISVGWVNAASHAFYGRVNALLRSHTLDRTQAFNNRMREFHLARIALFLPVAYAINILIWFIADHAGLFRTPEAARIAAFGLAAFPWLTVGLWNVSLLFSLSLPWAALPPAAVALLANTGCGYLLSRVWSYDLAIAGFFIGAAVFGIGSSLSVSDRFRRLDYLHLVSGA
jgi:hypothetical protein